MPEMKMIWFFWEIQGRKVFFFSHCIFVCIKKTPDVPKCIWSSGVLDFISFSSCVLFLHKPSLVTMCTLAAWKFVFICIYVCAVSADPHILDSSGLVFPVVFLFIFPHFFNGFRGRKTADSLFSHLPFFQHLWHMFSFFQYVQARQRRKICI